MAELSQRAEWAEMIDVVRTLLNAVVVRTQYPEKHPAIAKADLAALANVTRALDRMPELVVALVDGEFVIMERPLPEARRRAPGFAEAMQRHGIECLVFLRGVDKEEISALARGLGAPPPPEHEAPATRDRLQSLLKHVLLRFVEVKAQDPSHKAAAQNAALIEPRVRELLERVSEWIANDTPFELETIRTVAEQILWCARARTFGLAMHSWGPGADFSAGHAANVAMIAAAMAQEAGIKTETSVDIIAAALLHDVGHMLLPAPIRTVPEPLLDEKGRRFHRYHPFLGARALFEGGCPPLWISVALEHHRGVDAGGFPELDDKASPHEAARIVAVANFFDRKRTTLEKEADPPELVVAAMRKLAGRYFDSKFVDLFLRAVGVFPPGTTVELTDRRSAVVTRTSPSEPLRPEVRLLGGDADVRLSLMDYEVRERRHVASIVRAIAPPLGVVPPEEADEILRRLAMEAAAKAAVPRSAAPSRPAPAHATSKPAPAPAGPKPASSPATSRPAPSKPAPAPVISNAPKAPEPARPSLGPKLSMDPPPPGTPSARPRYKPIPREEPDD
jgi:HD-GYP domain-containing protein (c-di-GMP phosphodiesterase class II)